MAGPVNGAAAAGVVDSVGSIDPTVGAWADQLARRGVYRGCTSSAPRRGTTHVPYAVQLRTAGLGRRQPTTTNTGSSRRLDSRSAIKRAASGCTTHGAAAPPRVEAGIRLHVGDDAHTGVPCWRSAQAWLTEVADRYDSCYDTLVRPHVGSNTIAKKPLLTVAACLAAHAEHATGRNVRPCNATLATLAEVSVRTVRRARDTLRRLGVATEVLRGRQRSIDERLESWWDGDKARGWASVWALHHRTPLACTNTVPTIISSAHLRSGKSFSPVPTSRVSTGAPIGALGRCATASRRRTSPDQAGSRLARQWRASERSPAWARRHSPDAWAGVLAKPAAHSWTTDDLNQLISDWAGTHPARLPDSPHKPIGLLGTMIAWHGDLTQRPNAVNEARDATEWTTSRTRIHEQTTAATTRPAQRAVGRNAAARHSTSVRAVIAAARQWRHHQAAAAACSAGPGTPETPITNHSTGWKLATHALHATSTTPHRHQPPPAKKPPPQRADTGLCPCGQPGVQRRFLPSHRAHVCPQCWAHQGEYLAIHHRLTDDQKRGDIAGVRRDTPPRR